MGADRRDLISVIVPVYNIQDYLPGCIKSIADQTYEGLEIILVDDGSTDESGRICDEWAIKDSRIRVIHKKNSGVSDTRNTGLEQTAGRFIVFVDGDDRIYPDMIEVLHQALVPAEADVAFGMVERESGRQAAAGNGQKVVELAGRQILDAYVDAAYDPHITKAVWDKMYTRKIIGDTRFLSGKSRGEDGLFNLEIMIKCRRCIHVEKTVYYYRDMRPGNITGTGTLNRLLEDRIPILLQSISLLERAGRKDLADRQSCFFIRELLQRYGEAVMAQGLEEKESLLKRLREELLHQTKTKKELWSSSFLGAKDRLRVRLLAASPALYQIIVKGSGKKE